MQFVFAPILGALSDRFGRRPVLLLSIFGLGFDYLLLFFAPTLAWLFVGRVIAGITGASMTVVNAYIADVTPPEQRAKYFGMLGAMFGLGFIVGPVVGGFLGSFDLRLPFLAAAVLALLNGLYGLFVLPESLRPEQRNLHVNWRTLNPLSSLAALGRYPLVRNLSGSFVLFGVANQVIFSTWVLFTEGVLGWGPAQNGMGLAVVGVLAIIVQAGLVGFAIRTFGERAAILGGLLIGVVQFTLLGLARTDLMFYVAVILGSLGGIAGPAIQGLVSRSVSEREQGTIQGALTSLNSVVGIFGPILATWVFAYFNGGGARANVPGAAFYLGGVCLLLGTLLTAIVLPRTPKPARPAADVIAEA